MPLTPEQLQEEIDKALGGGAAKGSAPSAPAKPTYTPSAPINYAAQNLQQKTAVNANAPGYSTKEALLAQGGRPLGQNTIIVGNDKFSLEAGTGLYRAFGTATANDIRQLGAQLMNEAAQNRTGAATANVTPEARPYAGMAGAPGTLDARAGPVIPGFDAYRQPGIGFPLDGNKPISGIANGLNTMTAGRQGSATQFPVAPGFRQEGQFGNSISFAFGNTSPGYLEPAMKFADTSVTPITGVPGSYVFGQGNVGDANRAYSVPINVGGGGAALMNVAGNNVQMNSADRSQGYGFALNAMPASSVFALTGRNASEDPASQAAQTLMLNSAIAQGMLPALMGTNPNQFGGWHAGTGNSPYSGNGGMGQGVFWNGYTPDPVVPLAGPVMTPLADARTVADLNYGGTGRAPVGGNGSSGSATGTLGTAFGSAPTTTGSMLGQYFGQAMGPMSYEPTVSAGPTGMPSVNAMIAAVQANQGTQTNNGSWFERAAAAIQDAKDRAEGLYGGGDIYGGGFGVDGGQRGFAGGGRIVVRPLGGPVTDGPKQMVTTGPKLLVDARTGKVEALMGEDNRDRDRIPDRELLRLSGPNNSRLDIKPLEPFAEGGYITTTPTLRNPTMANDNEGYEVAAPYAPPTVPVSQPTGETGYGGASQPTGETGYQQPVAPPTAAPPVFEMPLPPVGYTPPVAPPPTPPVPEAPTAPVIPNEIPIDPGGIIVNNFDAFSPDILAPWERAQRELAVRDATRDRYGYRNAFAGLKGPTAIAVEQGDVPQTELPPGMYYDPSGQVTRTMGNIIGAQEAYRAAGAEEDITPVMFEVGEIGVNLDNFQKIRDLTLQRTGVAASSSAGSNEAALAAAAAAGEAQAAFTLLHGMNQGLQAQLTMAGGNTKDPGYMEYVNALNAASAAYNQANARANALANQASSASNTSFDQRLAAIDAQLAELQGSLPEGFSEAAARTKLAELNQKVSLNNKRILLKGEVANLAKIGVPKLNGPIIPVAA
jgi:hypothetical protein